MKPRTLAEQLSELKTPKSELKNINPVVAVRKYITYTYITKQGRYPTIVTHKEKPLLRKVKGHIGTARKLRKYVAMIEENGVVYHYKSRAAVQRAVDRHCKVVWL